MFLQKAIKIPDHHRMVRRKEGMNGFGLSCRVQLTGCTLPCDICILFLAYMTYHNVLIPDTLEIVVIDWQELYKNSGLKGTGYINANYLFTIPEYRLILFRCRTNNRSSAE